MIAPLRAEDTGTPTLLCFQQAAVYREFAGKDADLHTPLCLPTHSFSLPCLLQP